jgi:methylase of polypeptide subunit release factors
MPSVDNFLEVGTAAGYVLAEVILNNKCKMAMGLDISEEAINNAKANMEKFGLKADIIVSDVLLAVNKEIKFDLIYWNYPFNHCFAKPSSGLNVIEQAARDPDYVHLDQLLATAKEYLKPNGYVIISFSLVIGNTKLMK